MTFDNLVLNLDRNAQNILVDAQWGVVLIDHSRAFTTHKELLEDKDVPRWVDRALIERLRGLTLEELRDSFDELLSKKQCKSILKRRDALVAHIDELAARYGESAIYF